LFEKERVIGEKGFKFDMPTFIYGDQIEDYKLDDFEARYIENIDYIVLDVLTKKEFEAMINCFKNSDSVKSKIKKRL
jgi:hypothetical protein